MSSGARPADADALDEALGILAPFGPEYGGGFANHGPMAVEALTAMGRAEAAVPWASFYRERLEPPPPGVADIEAWEGALGDLRRASDWKRLFERELSRADWPVVLDGWVGRLAPGSSGAATHGLIRTAHAVRSLSLRDAPVRRNELAEGLAYWAATYETLPEERAAGSGRASAPDALRRIETLPPDRARPSGFISEGLHALRDLPSFASVADSLDLDGDLSRILSDVTSAFAHVYLANALASGRRVTFVHTITAPAAARLLLPCLRPETARAAVRYAWQAAAGMYAAFGESGRPEPPPRPGVDPDALRDRAVASRDEHAIKLTEACLREHALRPDPAFLDAASDACDRLRG